MSGDVHVRFCESLGVKFPRATHPDQGFDEWYGILKTTDESVYSSLEGFAESGITETFVFRLLDQKRVTRRRGAVQ